MIISAGLNALLNYLWVPQFGMTGAAIASLISLCIYALLGVVQAWFYAKMQPISLSFAKPVAAGLLAIFAVHFVYLQFSFLKSIFFFLGLLAVYGLIYFGLLLLFKSFDSEDREIINMILKKVGISYRF
jgi:O-antigen/teichoic acid export membrane protein